MTIHEIADRFVKLVKKKKYAELHSQLYAAYVLCKENEHVTQVGSMVKKDIPLRLREWYSGDLVLLEPSILGNSFALAQVASTADKDKHGSSQKICIYKVINGKIVKEQFFLV